MGDFDTGNPDVNDPTQFYYNQGVPLPPVTISPTIITGDVTVVTTLNGGGGGQATGPSITFGSNWSGVNFIASAGNVNIEITNAANARAALGAAKSGSNGDITDFTGLSGNTGWSNWTGTQDKTSHSTYPATVASAAYDQTQMQALMDKMQQQTEAFFALLTALFAWGGVKP